MTQKAIDALAAHAYVIAYYANDDKEHAIKRIKELYDMVKKLYEFDVISSKKRDMIFNRLSEEVKKGLEDYRKKTA